LKNRSVNFFEIDKNVTNVTIKDAPWEAVGQPAWQESSKVKS
jgi:hypothetical protein